MDLRDSLDPSFPAPCIQWYNGVCAVWRWNFTSTWRLRERTEWCSWLVSSYSEGGFQLLPDEGILRTFYSLWWARAKFYDGVVARVHAHQRSFDRAFLLDFSSLSFTSRHGCFLDAHTHTYIHFQQLSISVEPRANIARPIRVRTVHRSSNLLWKHWTIPSPLLVMVQIFGSITKSLAFFYPIRHRTITLYI